MTETAFKEGNLWFPPQGVLGQLKKSWHKKYCQLFKCSKQGVDRLEVFESEDEVGRTCSNLIITLENCIKITQDAQKHQPHAFAVISKCSTFYFAASSHDEMQEWISAFQVVAFKDNISRQTIEEDNDLYCPSEADVGVFSVKLVQSEASVRCGLPEGNYRLIVTRIDLQLQDEDERILFMWPYRYIRRYGYRAGKFTFEAGRKCESGEGSFHFEHSNQQEIFRCISSKMRSMKKLLNGETRSIVCGNDQLHAALSMVARSRSPLPPSPTTSTRILDSELCPISSVKPLMPLPIAVTINGGLHSTDIPLPPPKPKPAARKNVSPPLENSICSSSSHLAYDDVETRSQAWRTMGISVASHAEPAFDISLFGFHKMDKKKFHSTPSHLDNYDRLQHVGSVPKQSTAPGYKRIGALVTRAPVPGISTEEPIFACRRADDFKGYGMIRKKSSPESLSLEEGLCSKLDYVIMCKSNVV